MSELVCPNCGSGHFLTAKTGPKTVFSVTSKGALHIIQAPGESSPDGTIHESHIYCGACSWHGSLEELIESGTS